MCVQRAGACAEARLGQQKKRFLSFSKDFFIGVNRRSCADLYKIEFISRDGFSINFEMNSDIFSMEKGLFVATF